MRKGQEDKLQETIELLKAVQDSTSVANLVTDADCKIISFNRRLKEFISKNWFHQVRVGDFALDFIHPDNIDDFKNELKQALAGRPIKSVY